MRSPFESVPIFNRAPPKEMLLPNVWSAPQVFATVVGALLLKTLQSVGDKSPLLLAEAVPVRGKQLASSGPHG